MLCEEEQPDSKRAKATARAVVVVIVDLPMLFSTPLGSERYKRAVNCAGGKKGSGVEFGHGMDYYRTSYLGDLLLRQRWI